MQRINCHPGILWSPLTTVSMDTKLSIDGEQLEGWTFEEHFIDNRVSTESVCEHQPILLVQLTHVNLSSLQ